MNYRQLTRFPQTSECCLMILMISLLVGLTTAYGQGTPPVQTTTDPPIEETIFTVCEQPPSFPDGSARLGDYIHTNVRYPEEAIKAKVEGKVFVSFIVTSSGRIKNVAILKGLGFGTNEEALRLMYGMPDWIPGRQSGHPVNVKYNLVIPFRLADIK